MQAQLHLIRVPEFVRILSLARGSGLIVHRSHPQHLPLRVDTARQAHRGLDQIHLRHHSQTLGTQHRRARVDQTRRLRSLRRDLSALPGGGIPRGIPLRSCFGLPWLTILQPRLGILALLRFPLRLPRRRQIAPPLVHLHMQRTPAFRIRILHEGPLHILIIEKPRAIHELVQHPRRHRLIQPRKPRQRLPSGSRFLPAFRQLREHRRRITPADRG